VKHLDSGDLRRMLDEPAAFGEAERLHAQTCEECVQRCSEISADAQQAQGALGGEVPVDMTRAYDRVRERVAVPARMHRWYPALTYAAVAAAFVLALLFTPLGTYARSFLTIFEPQQFQPIEVSRADLRDLHLLPQANDIGVQRLVRKPQRSYYATITGAQKHASFTLLHPTVLPANFGTVHSFFIESPREMTFTFSAAKARAFEARAHKKLPPMPAGLDGTTIRFQTAQVFRAHYESADSRRTRNRETGFFELIETPAPRVSSSGASLDELERYLLSMPNVSPKLAAQIRALADIQSTIPVPVEIDKEHAQAVTIAGAKGLAVGDNTGLGAGVMWEKNGMIYALGGPVSMDEILKIADGLR
jgi:hypothetical protein